ncbi:hypothetical protein HDV57DRAFT_492100 [Trichoderma longibrachiatum]|uniref:Uncharacterized protein n=1 Tax=Trichoderma longibrachiatum ATCC 18648 TaxID=983965 RepID=A0A2T4C2P6_TRILO|nr:hypothetical protein M440DRAFT_1402369 [Trichoderma longibrachiatum ATCC 18648]
MALVHQMTRPGASELVAVVHRLNACLTWGAGYVAFCGVDGVGLGAESRAVLLVTGSLPVLVSGCLGKVQTLTDN